MNFPRELMRITEIERECKVSRKLLLQAYLTPGQNFAFKMNPLKSNSPIVFQTDGLKKWMDKRPEVEQRARRRSCVM